MSLITFDFHNTLAQCDRWFALEIRDLPGAVLRETGHATDAESPLIARATAIYRSLRRRVTTTGVEIDALDSVTHVYETLDLAHDRDELAAHIETLMRGALTDLHAVPGAPDLVRGLRARGFQLGVISSAVYHPFLEWSLDQFELRDEFDFVVSSASAGHYKSSPRIYEHALALVDADPATTIHIGDSPRWDVTTASSLAISTVLLNVPRTDTHTASDDDLATPDLVVDTLVDAEDAIAELAASRAERPAATPEPALRVDILTLFPGMFVGPFTESILKRAQAEHQIEIQVHDIRQWTTDKHHTADDTPYGGGAGMVMKAPPIVEGVEQILGDDLGSAHIAITSAGGRRFTQQIAYELATVKRLVLICGHYEGIDERVSTLLNADELSIGDYVMTGGEIPAMVIVDTIARLIPGVIDAASIADESHAEGRTLVEYPHYTRPVEYRGLKVPDVLLSGHHAKIDAWREDEARKRTERWRPDLLAEEPS